MEGGNGSCFTVCKYELLKDKEILNKVFENSENTKVRFALPYFSVC